jgi:hypothetical protein
MRSYLIQIAFNSGKGVKSIVSSHHRCIVLPKKRGNNHHYRQAVLFMLWDVYYLSHCDSDSPATLRNGYGSSGHMAFQSGLIPICIVIFVIHIMERGLLSARCHARTRNIIQLQRCLRSAFRLCQGLSEFRKPKSESTEYATRGGSVSWRILPCIQWLQSII